MLEGVDDCYYKFDSVKIAKILVILIGDLINGRIIVPVIMNGQLKYLLPRRCKSSFINITIKIGLFILKKKMFL